MKECLREIGCCIYCGTTDGELTEEHIVPFALGANLVLGHASCFECQKKTSAIEHHVCRPIAGMARVRLNIQTRRPKKRLSFPQKVQKGDEWKTVMADPEEFPALLSYPVFDKPGIVANRPPEGQYRQVGLWSLGFDDDFRLVAERARVTHQATSINLIEFRPTVLMNFVAKVAHAAACGLLPPDSFEPMLTLAATTEGVFDYVLGGGGSFPPQEGVLHSIEIRQVNGNSGSLIFARLRWFAHLAPPMSQIATGDPILGPPSFLAIVGRPRANFFKNKLAFININLDGTSIYGVQEIPSDFAGQAMPLPRK